MLQKSIPFAKICETERVIRNYCFEENQLLAASLTMEETNGLYHELKRIVENLTTPLTLPTCKGHSLEMQFENDHETKTEYQSTKPSLPFSNSKVFNTKVVSWRRLTAPVDCADDKRKNVYEVTFDVKDSNYTWRAGDTIGVIPHNKEDDVNTIIEHLHLESVADSSYTLIVASGQKGKIAPHIPVKSTLRHVLKHCIELRGVLKKLFLLSLSKHTTLEAERKQIQYLCSTEGSSAYHQFILNPYFCIVDLFKTFRSCKPPIEVLLSHLPRLLPRPYSIVNSGLVDSDVLKICFSVKSCTRGVTTGWLEHLILVDDCEEKLLTAMGGLRIENCNNRIENIVPIYLRMNRAQFSLPDSTNPIIFIAVGTAISPFIGFLDEIEKRNSNMNPQYVWLFFGCRDPKLDHIYEKELNGFLKRGVLTELDTAFSHKDCGEEHVQDLLRKKSAELANLIESNASVFVCGDFATFAHSVNVTIQECLVQTGRSKGEASAIIRDMEKSRRYVVDSWA